MQGPPHESLWKWHLSSVLITKKIKDSIGPALWYKTDFFPYYKTIWKGFREIKIVKFNWRKTWNENVSKVFCQKCFFTQKEQFMVLKNIKIRQKPWIRIHTCNTIVLLTCRTYKRIYFPFPMRSITYWIIFFSWSP